MGILRSLLNRLRPKFRKVYLAQHVKCHRSAHLHFSNRLTIGKYTYIGPGCTLNAEGGISIGDGSILAPDVVVLSSSHDYRMGELLPYDKYDVRRPVSIGAGVWIGQCAMISPGVTIGDGAVVAMGAMVTRDVNPGEVVGGNPARVISTRDVAEIERRVGDAAYFHRQYWSGPRPREESPNA